MVLYIKVVKIDTFLYNDDSNEITTIMLPLLPLNRKRKHASDGCLAWAQTQSSEEESWVCAQATGYLGTTRL